MTIARMRFGTTVTVIPAAIAIVSVLYLVIFPAWTVDDAYITLRYAQNLVRHGALSWNMGDAPVEGYTGVLWTLLAAAAMRIHIDPVWLLRITSMLHAVAIVGNVDRILVNLRSTTQQRLIAFGLLALGPWWAMHIWSGLETILFTSLILIAIHAYQQQSVQMPLIVLACGLTRPEGVLLAIVLFIASWYEGRIVKFRYWIAFFIVPGAIYFFWRWNYYGLLFPNTFYAKSGGSTSWTHVAAFAATCVLLPVLAWWISRPSIPKLRPLAMALMSFTAILIVFYGQSDLLMNYGHRFFVPLLPLITIALAATWGAFRINYYIVSYALICGVFAAGNALWAYNYERMEQTEHAPAAAWIAEHMPSDATLMVIVDAGLVPYRTGLRTIDVGALNDTYLSHQRDPHQRVDYLFAQAPDVVLLATGDLGIEAANQTRSALLADPRWHAYQRVQSYSGEGRWEYHQEIWVKQ